MRACGRVCVRAAALPTRNHNLSAAATRLACSHVACCACWKQPQLGVIPRRFPVKGWLAALVQTLEANPHAGLVGPMLADADGQVTGSPGLVFDDGSAAPYFDGAKPDHTNNFLRKADYIPAACMVIPKFLLEKIGGFDPQVSPGALCCQLACQYLACWPGCSFCLLSSSSRQGACAGTGRSSERSSTHWMCGYAGLHRLTESMCRACSSCRPATW
jgi:hypothetical protein